MAYVAARGGEAAIAEAERFFRQSLGPITLERVRAIETALPYLVDRVMGEASLYVPEIAALALAQSGGDLSEAVLLLRAYRTTQPRLAYAEPVELNETLTVRRVSAAFKDIPGGQLLGPTLDYSHRVLRTEVLTGTAYTPDPVTPAKAPAPRRVPTVADWQRSQGLIAEVADREESNGASSIPDLTREPLLFPPPRAHTLQALARADTGGTLALGYASMRGYGPVHPTVNEVRLCEADVRLPHPKGSMFSAGRVRVSQAEIVSTAGGGDAPLKIGFAATLGWNEIKTIAGATLDLAMRSADPHPANTAEFVLYHTEPIEASGFCLHFKLPHYVTFQSTLDGLRGTQKQSAGEADDPALVDEPDLEEVP